MRLNKTLLWKDLDDTQFSSLIMHTWDQIIHKVCTHLPCIKQATQANNSIELKRHGQKSSGYEQKRVNQDSLNLFRSRTSALEK